MTQEPAAAQATQASHPVPPGVWRLRLLGGFELSDGGLHLTHLRSRATTLLLARLALAPQQHHAREELCDLLWPDADATAARSRLRQTLSLLRAVLEPPGHGAVIEADRRCLRLAPGALWCDAPAFLQLAGSASATVAAAAYGGILLPGFYDEWVLQERQHLATVHERCAAALSASAPTFSDIHSNLPKAPARADAAASMAASTSASTPALTPASTAALPPMAWTRLFGAELATTRLLAAVRTHRLVTLCGPGGAGKTRLALEVTRVLYNTAAPGQSRPTSRADFDRVGFVHLLPCQDTDQALDAMGRAVLAQGLGNTMDRLVNALWQQRSLLVLDNAEHLGVGLADALGELLARVAGLHLLVTSRRALDLEGENVWPQLGLELPPAHATPAQAAQNPAVALFVARALAAQPDFHLSPGNTPAVVGLVRLLGGMPLAIELAAARTRSIGPAPLLQRLRENAGTPLLDLLARKTRRAAADTRHASMRHVMPGAGGCLAPHSSVCCNACLCWPASCLWRLPRRRPTLTTSRGANR